MCIAKNIRVARRAARLTQQQLAKKAHMSLRTLQNTECQKHSPDLNTLSKLAAALDSPLAVLLDDDVSPEAYRVGLLVERLRPEDRSVVVGMVERLGMVA